MFWDFAIAIVVWGGAAKRMFDLQVWWDWGVDQFVVGLKNVSGEGCLVPFVVWVVNANVLAESFDVVACFSA